MKVLGIDTILHDVCAAVVENNRVLSNEVKSQSMTVAKDSLLDLVTAHIKEVGEILKKALDKSNFLLKDISLIAVNNSGSLFSNVLIGVVTANTLAQMYDIPIVEVDHQEAHIFSNWIGRNSENFNFPILVFSASGGHNLIALVTKNNFRFKVISKTKGIDKKNQSSPSFLGLGALFSDVVCYLRLSDSQERKKGDGQFISTLARKGNANRFNFYSGQFHFKKDLDFSKLKQKTLRTIRKEKKGKGSFSLRFIYDLAASFESSLSKMIADYLGWLAKEKKTKEIHLVGGVSANWKIRKELKKKGKKINTVIRYPKRKSFCTDNGAMIANLGYLKFKQNPQKYLKQRHLNVKSDLILENLAINQFLNQNKNLN